MPVTRKNESFETEEEQLNRVRQESSAILKSMETREKAAKEAANELAALGLSETTVEFLTGQTGSKDAEAD